MGEPLGVLLHLSFGFLGCALSVAMTLIINGILSASHAHIHASSSIYNPLFWTPGLFIGAIVNRFARNRWAFASPAVLGFLIILIVMWREVLIYRTSEYFLQASQGHFWRYELQNLFSTEPRSLDSGVLQLLVTFPFLVSVAYSIGAWIGFRVGRASVPRPYLQ